MFKRERGERKKVETAAMRLTDLSELKRSQEAVIIELLATKIRLVYLKE